MARRPEAGRIRDVAASTGGALIGRARRCRGTHASRNAFLDAAKCRVNFAANLSVSVRTTQRRSVEGESTLLLGCRQEHFKTRLLEMSIGRQGGPDLQFVHDDKTRAVGKGIPVI